MALTLNSMHKVALRIGYKSITSYHPVLTLRSYSDSDKSIYQRDEEGEKPRTAFGKPYPDWRTPWGKRPGEFNSKLSVFVEKSPSPDILNYMQNVPYLTIDKIKDWWADLKELQETQNQRYIPERTQYLGANLGALHFFTYRGAAVRLKDTTKWIEGTEKEMMERLPRHREDGYFVEAIDCSNFKKGGIRYEGLQNLVGLNFLKWLSLRNNKFVLDEWGLDRVAYHNGKYLEYLDISGTKLSLGCIYAVSKIEPLNVLVISDPGEDIELLAALAMLEHEKPKLLIKIVE